MLKMIRNELLNSSELRGMFLDEVKILLNLQHSSIAQFIDFFEENGRPVLVLEYVQGASLSELLIKLSQQGILLPPVLATHIMLKVAEALAFIHSFKDPMSQEPLQIIHRDISPSNILLSFAGEVKLIDFGVAKYSAKTEQTQLGTIKGKPFYMSPEQKRGLDLTDKSDIFSFGIVFCEIIRGARFQHESAHSDHDDIRLNISEIRQAAHSDIAELIASCLEMNPANRTDAQHIVRVLSRYIADYGGGIGASQLGSFLKSRMTSEWESTTSRLSRILNSPSETKQSTPINRPATPHKSVDGQSGFSKNLSEIIEGGSAKTHQAEEPKVHPQPVDIKLYMGSDPPPTQARRTATNSSNMQSSFGERAKQTSSTLQQRVPLQMPPPSLHVKDHRKAQAQPKPSNMNAILFVLILSFILLLLSLKNNFIKNLLSTILR